MLVAVIVAVLAVKVAVTLWTREDVVGHKFLNVKRMKWDKQRTRSNGQASGSLFLCKENFIKDIESNH